MIRNTTGSLAALMALPYCVAASVPIPPLTTQTIATIPSNTNELVTTITQSPDPADDRLIIVGKSGRVYALPPGGTPALLLNISTITSSGGERGLLSLEFHPEFGSANRYFYINHTNTAGNTVVARYEMNEAGAVVADSRRVLLTITQPESNHNGGAIKFGLDGYLYIAMGDGGGGNDPGCHSQNMASRLGKMLRIDVDQNVDTVPYHGIPADNPFVGDDGIPDEIYFSGLRNPWRFSFDRDAGDIWIADVGQGTREEVNHVPFPYDAELNFGWPIREGNIQNPSINTVINNCNNNGVTIPPLNYTGFTNPVYTYATGTGGSRSITGGYVYRGAKTAGLFGRYIFGDYISGRVWVLDPADYTATERLNLGTGLATFGEDRAGELYLGHNLTVRRIVPVPPEIADHWAVK